jgi:hypothetical protein
MLQGPPRQRPQERDGCQYHTTAASEPQLLTVIESESFLKKLHHVTLHLPAPDATGSQSLETKATQSY